MVLVAPYKPLKITGMATGLVQEREEFILPNDAYPTLLNAYVWRERILRKNGYELLGRLRRKLTMQVLGVTVFPTLTYTFPDILAAFRVTQPNAEIEPATLVISIAAPDAATFTDNGDGTFAVTGVGVAAGSSVNYITGAVTIVISAVAGGAAITAAFNYFPALPVMGLRSRELSSTNFEQTIAFDQVYAYIFVLNGWQEFLPATATVWTGSDSQFFWSTNYWQTSAPTNRRLFWVTNFNSPVDPIRYTDGVTWTAFAPQTNSVVADLLVQARCILPFRSRLVVFNTVEFDFGVGANISYPQRIRWAAIGNPILVNSWFDDVRGRGGFLDIPTSEDIISVGFVRDNLVIYCERSTWQLRYTGRSISPFQIEKVNSELGAESTFSTVQFDTSLVGIGDKGVVECDSFKSELIDVKIPDLVFDFKNTANGQRRVHGARDFIQRLAYWIYPYAPSSEGAGTFPNRRLVYNYENQSWAIFTDSLTCLGTFQPSESRTWASTPIPWQNLKFPWLNFNAQLPLIVGGNQQGFVLTLDLLTTNDVGLSITGILGNTPLATTITSQNHNLEDNMVIGISQIPVGTPFANLNGGIFQVNVLTPDTFDLYIFNPSTQVFDIPQQDAPAVYVGGGKINIRDNFSVISKKFNFLDEGMSIQIGYIDILMDATSEGEISMLIYLDYADDTPSNILPDNINPSTLLSDTFFNSVIPTSDPNQLTNPTTGTKFWHRAFCPTNGNFLTIQYTFSNQQMAGRPQEKDVQIDAQVLWLRKGGRMTVNI